MNQRRVSTRATHDAGLTDDAGSRQASTGEAFASAVGQFWGVLVGGYLFDAFGGLRGVSVMGALLASSLMCGAAFVLYPYEMQASSADPKVLM